MLLAQLVLALLLGMLGPLASAERVRGDGAGWYRWSGVLLAAWVAGVSGLLILRFPDWAVLYLFEAMGPRRIAVALLGAALSLLAAWAGMSLVVPPLLAGRTGAALVRTVAAVALGAALLYLVRERLSVMATTFEFRRGIARPLARVDGFPSILALVLIGLSVPCLGALLLLLIESVLAKRRASAD